MFSINLGNSKDDKENNKIITDENAEETKVTWAIYKKYQEYNGGCKQFFLVNLSNVLFIVCKTLGDYLVGNWATAPD